MTGDGLYHYFGGFSIIGNKNSGMVYTTILVYATILGMVYTTILGIFHYWTWYNPQNNPLLGMDNPLFSIYTTIFWDIPL